MTTEEKGITKKEYQDGVARAQRECRQEIAAATAEYKDAVRPHAEKRKERGVAAREKRTKRIEELKSQLNGRNDEQK